VVCIHVRVTTGVHKLTGAQVAHLQAGRWRAGRHAGQAGRARG
jgi:hypothetical protein